METVNKRGKDKKFVLLTSIEGNAEKHTEVKKYIDVSSIREITECNDYFGFQTTQIIFDNRMEPIYIKSSIEDVCQYLKNAEKI